MQEPCTSTLLLRSSGYCTLPQDAPWLCYRGLHLCFWGLRLRAAQLTPEGQNALRTVGTPLHVMIAGAPAAGKGTQCQRIVEKVLHSRRACQGQ